MMMEQIQNGILMLLLPKEERVEQVMLVEQEEQGELEIQNTMVGMVDREDITQLEEEVPQEVLQEKVVTERKEGKDFMLLVEVVEVLTVEIMEREVVVVLLLDMEVMGKMAEEVGEMVVKGLMEVDMEVMVGMEQTSEILKGLEVEVEEQHKEAPQVITVVMVGYMVVVVVVLSVMELLTQATTERERKAL